MNKKSFYITTTLPYVNAEPHIGFAMEIVQADIIARWNKLQGDEVFFNTGTDEHGLKVYNAALAEGKDPQKYCDELSEKFKNLKKTLGLSEDLHFIRTTSEQHKKAAQEVWKKCSNAGYIEKKQYKLKYCTGCELEKTDSELENGRCIIHPNLELEVHEEENYFFKFSEFGPKLMELYKNPNFVVPDFRLNEMRALIDKGLEDFSISRLKDKMPWGVSVPGDDKHVMYVWFDALTSYISTLGWPDDAETFNKFWNGESNVQFAGKDQVRQQAAMWQAMLIAAGLPPTSQIVIHGFINLEGQKMSKSLGNVISPQDLISKFGLDSFRVMMAGVNQFEDTDVSMEGFSLTHNNNLANGLGNLVARIMRLSETYLSEPVEIGSWFDNQISSSLNDYEIKKTIEQIWAKIGAIDLSIQTKKPWETKNTSDIKTFVKELARVAYSIAVFMPTTSQKILNAIKENKMPESLFPRI